MEDQLPSTTTMAQETTMAIQITTLEMAQEAITMDRIPQMWMVFLKIKSLEFLDRDLVVLLMMAQITRMAQMLDLQVLS